VRIVFDSNMLVRAHQHAQGPARRALLQVIAAQDVIVLSGYILSELGRVLRYPRLSQRSGLTPNDIAAYLEQLANISWLVTPEAVPPLLLRDAEDAPILGTALAGKADFLCTRDTHFFDARVVRFCADRGIRVLTELELLENLRS